MQSSSVAESPPPVEAVKASMSPGSQASTSSTNSDRSVRGSIACTALRKVQQALQLRDRLQAGNMQTLVLVAARRCPALRSTLASPSPSPSSYDLVIDRFPGCVTGLSTLRLETASGELGFNSSGGGAVARLGLGGPVARMLVAMRWTRRIVVLPLVCTLLAGALEGCRTSRASAPVTASRASAPVTASRASAPVTASSAPQGSLRPPNFSGQVAPRPSGANPNGDPAPTGFSSVPQCPSPTWCVAVGSYQNSSGTQLALIATYSNGMWTALTAPLPAGSDYQSVYLSGVSCISADRCIAVGSYETESSSVPLIEKLAHGAWTPQAAPLPPNAAGTADNDLASVSCFALGRCVAVGSYGAPSNSSAGLIETLANGKWTPTVAPEPRDAATGTDAQLDLGSTFCDKSGSCIASGTYTTDSGQYEQGLSETNVGGAWAGSTMGLPSDADVQNPDVSLFQTCITVANCIDVVAYRDSSDASQVAVDTLSNGTWRQAALPLPRNAGSDPEPLVSAPASCRSVVSCIIVGGYNNSEGLFSPLIASISGGLWTSREAPIPADGDVGQPAGLSSVSCVVGGSCVAIGGYSKVGTQLMAELMQGALVTPVDVDTSSIPNQPEFSAIFLKCSSARTCVGVGNYTDSSNMSWGVTVETGR
jgi:hypothetical protein